MGMKRMKRIQIIIKRKEKRQKIKIKKNKQKRIKNQQCNDELFEKRMMRVDKMKKKKKKKKKCYRMKMMASNQKQQNVAEEEVEDVAEAKSVHREKREWLIIMIKMKELRENDEKLQKNKMVTVQILTMLK